MWKLFYSKKILFSWVFFYVASAVLALVATKSAQTVTNESLNGLNFDHCVIFHFSPVIIGILRHKLIELVKILSNDQCCGAGGAFFVWSQSRLQDLGLSRSRPKKWRHRNTGNNTYTHIAKVGQRVNWNHLVAPGSAQGFLHEALLGKTCPPLAWPAVRPLEHFLA